MIDSFTRNLRLVADPGKASRQSVTAGFTLPDIDRQKLVKPSTFSIESVVSNVLVLSKELANFSDNLSDTVWGGSITCCIQFMSCHMKPK